MGLSVYDKDPVCQRDEWVIDNDVAKRVKVEFTWDGHIKIDEIGEAESGWNS